MNHLELSRGVLRFRTFLPNALYRRGLLPNLYYSCAAGGAVRGDGPGAAGHRAVLLE